MLGMRSRWLVTIAIVIVAGCGSAASPSPSAGPSPTPAPPSQTPLATAEATEPKPSVISGLPLIGTIALTRNTEPGRLDDAHRLFTMPARGGDATLLLSGDGEQARWSADGQRLSIVGPSPQGLVFVGFVDRDGTDLVRLNSPDPALNLGCGAWSRDGSTFACEAWDDDDPSRRGIYTVIAEDGGGLRRLTTAPPDAQDAPCDFAPDGSRLYFIRIDILAENESELLVVNLDGTGEARLIDAPVSLRCRLSPDGQTLLVEAGGQILVVPLGDLPDGVHPLSVDLPRGSELGYPAWSPDGAHIAFSASTPGQPLDLWVAEPNGDSATKLTDTPDIHEWLESWGP